MNTDKHFYHCATKGLEDNALFSSREQFIAGMNRAALCCLYYPEVIIIAFVLMDNHVHFILHGTFEDCNGFMAQYKKLTGIYLSNTDSVKLGKLEFDCWMIPNKEKLMEKICYVLRNPLAAGMNILPTSYPWGSGQLMFSAIRDTPVAGFHLLGCTSTYYRLKIFGTKHELPGSWYVNDEGMIWPGSYVKYKRAESAFDSLTNFMFELNKKNEDIVNQEMYGSRFSLNDYEVLKILKDSSGKTFGIEDLSLLTVDQRIELISSVRRTYGTDIKQLGRLLHLRRNDLELIWEK